MRTILLIAITMAAMSINVSAGAASDEKSSALIKRISSTLDAYGSYEVRFTVSADGMDDIDGNYLVSGDRYRIDVQGDEHISDGKVRYEISHDYKEIVVDNADPNGGNIFTNPARAFAFADDQMESKWLRSETRLGRECDVVMLRPVDNKTYGNINMTITLYVDSSDGLPVFIRYDYDGEPISISITGIRKLDKVDNSLFAFDRTDYPDYEIIDFRD